MEIFIYCSLADSTKPCTVGYINAAMKVYEFAAAKANIWLAGRVWDKRFVMMKTNLKKAARQLSGEGDAAVYATCNIILCMDRDLCI